MPVGGNTVKNRIHLVNFWAPINNSIKDWNPPLRDNINGSIYAIYYLCLENVLKVGKLWTESYILGISC